MEVAAARASGVVVSMEKDGVGLAVRQRGGEKIGKRGEDKEILRMYLQTRGGRTSRRGFASASPGIS